MKNADVVEGHVGDKKPPKLRLAILGWGSLLWDHDHPRAKDFEDQLDGDWKDDGPTLPIEFCRVSGKVPRPGIPGEGRLGALTLIIVPPPVGTPTVVAWRLSRRSTLEDAACDLRVREGTIAANIARVEAGKIYDEGTTEAMVAAWASAKRIDAVVWTNLPDNFKHATKTAETETDFSVQAAVAWIRDRLTPAGKAKAAEYVWCAPAFVQTPVRDALQQEPWFKSPTTTPAKQVGKP